MRERGHGSAIKCLKRKTTNADWLPGGGRGDVSLVTGGVLSVKRGVSIDGAYTYIYIVISLVALHISQFPSVDIYSNALVIHLINNYKL